MLPIPHTKMPQKQKIAMEQLNNSHLTVNLNTITA